MPELYTEPVVETPTYDQISDQSAENTFQQPRLVSPIMNGIMKGQLIIQSATPGSSERIIIDGTNGKITVGVDSEIIIDAQTQKITLGSSNIVLDALNKYILVSDGTNDRILIGYDAGGF